MSRYDETRANDMLMVVGGSVYNTSLLLAYYNLNIDFYTLNHNGAYSNYIEQTIKTSPLNVVKSEKDIDNTAISVILLDDDGEKKIISYDGVRNDKDILLELEKESKKYDLFYTSFYEINTVNIDSILRVLDNVKKSFIDLSPLIYRVPQQILFEVLSRVEIVSGTQDEFRLLFEIIGVHSIKSLMKLFSIHEVYEKRGRHGATLYTMSNNCSETKHRIITTIDVDAPGSGNSKDTTGCGDTFSAAVIAGKTISLSGEDLLKFAVNSATFVAYCGFSPQTIIAAWKDGFSF